MIRPADEAPGGADETVRFSVSGPYPGCGRLPRECRAKIGALVVIHPYYGEFFEGAKRLGPTHSSLEDGWVASSQKHPVKSAGRGHAMGLPARHSAHFAGPQVRLRRETRRAGGAAGWSLRDPELSLLDHGAVRLPLSAALSIATMMRCTATASSKLAAERVFSRRS